MASALDQANMPQSTRDMTLSCRRSQSPWTFYGMILQQRGKRRTPCNL